MSRTRFASENLNLDHVSRERLRKMMSSIAPRVSRLSQILRLSVTINMPPSRSASTSKRKASPAPSDEDAPKATKKSKVSAASASRYSDQPTNKVLPVKIDFPQRVPNTLRFATWNVAGLAASQKKGFKYYVEAEDPDILVLTETKVHVISRLLAFVSHFI
jgi:hypothetical protein